MKDFNLLIKNGICLTPAGRVQVDIGIRDGKIALLGDISDNKAIEIFDAKNLHILPGVIDSQVHFREPGLTHKEDIESGALGAAFGGVTGFFEMPNTNPATLTADTMQTKLDIATLKSAVNYAFYIGGASDNISELASLEKITGVCGIKIFMGSSTGSLLVEEEEILRKILQNSRSRIAIHAEDEQRLRSRFHLAEESGNVAAHPIWRDGECALLATKKIIRIAVETNRTVHILHISTKQELPILAAHKDLITAEITPQHLTFSAPEIYERLGTFAQMNPPIRDKTHQHALWDALNQGVFDCIGSDHAPHTIEEKSAPYPKSPSGMTGVQTLVPVMLTHIANGKLSLERLVDLTAHGPARIFNIKAKGRIAQGYDADFTIIDLNAKRVISNSQIKSKSGWTAFDGFKTTGWVMATIVNGAIVMRDDQLLKANSGKPIEFIR